MAVLAAMIIGAGAWGAATRGQIRGRVARAVPLDPEDVRTRLAKLETTVANLLALHEAINDLTKGVAELNKTTAGLIIATTKLTEGQRRIRAGQHRTEARMGTLAEVVDTLATERMAEQVTARMLAQQRAGVTIGSVGTGGGAAAIGGDVDDRRREQGGDR